MTAALATCILVVGGVVIPSDDQSSFGSGVQEPAPLLGEGFPAGPDGDEMSRGLGRQRQGFGQQRGSRPAARPQQQQQAPQQQMMPFAPTEPGVESIGYPWGSPTSSEPFDFESMRLQQPTGGRSSFSGGMPGSSGVYGGSRAGRPQSSKYSSLTPHGSRSARLSAKHTAAAHAPRATASKPFSNYKRAPAVSPYMDLFRLGTSVGSDNYNSLVRPQLQQMNTNRQVGRAVRGLQGTTRNQGAAIQNIGRKTGIATPQRYMDYGGYYPGMGR